MPKKRDPLNEVASMFALKEEFKPPEELLNTLINYGRNVTFLNKEDVDLLKINLDEVIPYLKKLKKCVEHMDTKKNMDEAEFQICWLLSLMTVFLSGVDDPSIPFLNKKYNESVKLRLYPAHILDVVNGIEGYNTFSVRLRDDNIIECLVCDYFVSQMKVEALFDHVCTLFHMEQLQLHCNNLSKYHDFWKAQKPIKQDIQLCYSYIDGIYMKCKQCGTLIKYDDVLVHPNPCKNRKVKKSQNIAKPISEVGYAPKIKQSIFFDVPYLNIDGINYPVMQRIKSKENNCVCLICSSMVTAVEYWGHCENDTHLFLQSSYTLTETLKKYHQIFSSFRASQQIEVANYCFHENSILCLPCQRVLNLDRAEIITHKNSNDHHNNLKSANLTLFFIINCYNIPNVMVGDTYYPIIQVCHDSTFYCLTCHFTLRRTIMEHLNQPEHVKSASNKLNISMVAAYHDAFKTLPDQYQSKKPFFRKQASDIRCVLCNACVPFDAAALLCHIKTRHLNVAKPQKVRAPAITVEDDRISGGDGMNVKQDKECPSESPSTQLPLPKGKVNRSDGLKADNKVHRKKKGAQKSAPNLHFVECPSESPSLQLPLPKGKDNLKADNKVRRKKKGSKHKDYHPDTIKELFEDVLHKFINGAFYPVFQRIGKTYHCLFCVETIQDSSLLHKHLSLMEHDNKLSSSQHMLRVQKYHEIFCSLPSKLQTQQIHFKIYSDVLECRLCIERLVCNVEAVKAHISTTRHKTMCDGAANTLKAMYWKLVWNYDYKDFNLDTLLFLMEQRIKGNIYNISDIIFQMDLVNLPCAYINKKFYPVFILHYGNMHCLICSKDILENPIEHVTNYVTHLRGETVYLQQIVKYYNIWDSLPENVQMQQAVFRIQMKHIKCLLCMAHLTYDLGSIKKHLNSEIHEQNFFKFFINRVHYQSELIVANNLGYYIDTNLKLDSMLYLADVEINKSKEHVFVSNGLEENNLVRNESVVRDTAADDFALQSISHYENVYGRYKTAQYEAIKNIEDLKRKELLLKNISGDYFPLQPINCYEKIYGRYKTSQYEAIKDLDDLKRKELLLKNISGDHFPLQPINCYEKNYGTYKTAQYKAIKDIQDFKKRELLLKNISGDHFPLQPINCYEKIYGTYKTAQYKAIKDFEEFKKREFLLKNISGDHFPLQPINCYEKIYGTYKTAEYKAIKDIEDYKKRELLHKNIAADKLLLESFNHSDNVYGIHTTNQSAKHVEINRNKKSLSLLKNSKSDVTVISNMDQNQIHNSQNYQQDDVYQKASIEFPPYDISTLNSIYKNGLIHYNIKIDNIKYPIIQNLGLYKHCMICEKSITSEIFHCNSDEHIKNSKIQLKKKLLKNFHQVFALLPKQYQEQQKYFRKEEQLKCILCKVGVEYDFGLILSHIQEKDHLMKQEKFEKSPSTSRGNSPLGNGNHPDTKPIERSNKSKKNVIEINLSSNINKPSVNGTSKETLKYSSPAMTKLFQNLEEYTITINNNDLFLFRNSILGIRCLLCNDSPVLNPANHVKTNNHLKFTVDKDALKNFEKLHQLWTMSKDSNQEQLFYIVQRHCYLCQVTLKLDYILIHIETKGHLDKVAQENHLAASTELLKEKMKTEVEKNGIIDNKKNASKKSVKVEIMSTYSEDISSDQELRDDVPNGVENGPNVENHVEKEDIPSTDNLQLNYASWVKSTVYYGLAKYAVSVDENLLPYLRRTFEGLRCILCQDEKVNSISDHLKSPRHTLQFDNSKVWSCVQDFHDYWSRKTDPISQNQQIFVINGKCVLCKRHDQKASIDEHLQSKEHRINEGDVDCDELIDAMGLRDKFRYCAEVEQTLYKDLDQYFTYHGLIKLPLLRLTKEGVRCILCDDTGVTAPAQHVKTPAHQQALHNYDKREKLWNFHKMWQKMEPEAQMHQQHVILMMCLACDRKISVDTGEAHVLSKAHQGNVKMKSKNQAKPKRVITHDVKPSVPSLDPHDLMSQIPFYFQPHLKYLKSEPDNKNEVTCTACNKIFTNITQIRTHLDTKEHCTAATLDQIKNQFLCEICMRKAKNEKEWLHHLSSGNHNTCFKSLGANRKSTMKENTCVTCNMVIFGDTISVLRHNKSKNNNGGVETTLTKGMKKLLSSKKAILTEAMNLVKIADQDIDKSKADVNDCCKALQQTLSAYYSKCRVYPFGSRVTGLGNKDSDLDVFIDIGGIYDGSRFQSADDQADIVLKVGNLLRKNKKQFSNIVTVPGARTPIVKVYHIETGIDCDISFRHGLSVENTEFIRFCIDLQPILRPTLLFLKLWLQQTELPYGTPTSYAFTMLVIFFMQQQNYLLSVEKLRYLNRRGKIKIDGWEVIEYTTSIMEMKKHVRECTLPIPELLKQFFGYYENFNFANLVVCPLLGHMIDKSHFVPQNPDLPPQMDTYVRKLKEPNPEVLRHHTPMCVQDPFDLSHNVTKGCPVIAAKMFQKYCKLSKSFISALE